VVTAQSRPSRRYKDRFDFLDRLGKACCSHGWRIHARLLMSNHFHPLVKTRGRAKWKFLTASPETPTQL
jgi:REP element-mobilizing transposase RayT